MIEKWKKKLGLDKCFNMERTRCTNGCVQSVR